MAKAWFPANVAAKLTVGKIQAEIERLGLVKPKRLGLSKMLAHFGHQLVEEKLVEVTKGSNLSRSDIKFHLYLHALEVFYVTFN